MNFNNNKLNIYLSKENGEKNIKCAQKFYAKEYDKWTRLLNEFTRLIRVFHVKLQNGLNY